MRQTNHLSAHALRLAGLFTIALAVSACSTADRRTQEEKAADRAIAEQVKAVLLADSNVYAEHIDIDAKRGVVWLSGWVSSADEKRAAASDTQSVPGVRRVVDGMEIMDWTTHY
jgi:osmotically-inducible protein OsmY